MSDTPEATAPLWRGSDMATLHIRNVRWEVECESCGIIDSGITRKAIAETLSEAHAEMHQPCCDAIRQPNRGDAQCADSTTKPNAASQECDAAGLDNPPETKPPGADDPAMKAAQRIWDGILSVPLNREAVAAIIREEDAELYEDVKRLRRALQSACEAYGIHNEKDCPAPEFHDEACEDGRAGSNPPTYREQRNYLVQQLVVAKEENERLANSMQFMQDDIAAALKALGLSDHARNASPHEVMTGEVIPAVVQLRERDRRITALESERGESAFEKCARLVAKENVRRRDLVAWDGSLFFLELAPNIPALGVLREIGTVTNWRASVAYGRYDEVGYTRNCFGPTMEAAAGDLLRELPSHFAHCPADAPSPEPAAQTECVEPLCSGAPPNADIHVNPGRYTNGHYFSPPPLEQAHVERGGPVPTQPLCVGPGDDDYGTINLETGERKPPTPTSPELGAVSPCPLCEHPTPHGTPNDWPMCEVEDCYCERQFRDRALAKIAEAKGATS